MPPDEDRIWRQYEISVEEYRFQLELNWKRSQYYFILNAAILVAATSLLSSDGPVPDGIVAATFFLGSGVAVLAMLATHTQIGYYHAARHQMQRLAENLELGELSLRTTPGLGATVRRLGRVTTFQFTILALLGAADLAGGIVALTN